MHAALTAGARGGGAHPIARWAVNRAFSPLEVDCATAVMLKIIDGKCKMSAQEKQVMAVVYDAVKHRPGELLDAGVHDLIAAARLAGNSSRYIETVYEQRVLAETMISRPVMKSFKAMLRQQGILAAN